MGASLLQPAQLSFIQPDTVRHLHVRTDHTNVLEVFQIAEAAFTQHLWYLILNLPCMSMNTCTMAVSFLFDLLEQAFGVPQLPARCKPIAATSTSLPMHALEKSLDVY